MSKALFHILGKNKNYQKLGLAGIGYIHHISRPLIQGTEADWIEVFKFGKFLMVNTCSGSFLNFFQLLLSQSELGKVKSSYFFSILKLPLVGLDL